MINPWPIQAKRRRDLGKAIRIAEMRAEIRAITALSEEEIEQRTKRYSPWALQGVIDRAKEGDPNPW